MNALTIADALATKYTALPPPAGYGAIRKSTARLPNKIAESPFVTVMLLQGEIVLEPQALTHGLDFRVIFHYAKHTGDLSRDMTALLAWIGVLVNATWADMDLGVTGVRKAYPQSYRFVVAEFGGDDWYGWELTVRVDVHESQAMAA